MTDAPHRLTYRVAGTIRDLSPEEERIVRERSTKLEADVRAREMQNPRVFLFGIGASGIVLVAGIVMGNTRVMAASAIAVAMFVTLLLAAHRAALKRVEARSDPWRPPKNGWQARETRIVSRSVTLAASGDEDYLEFLLFEIPGGDWFYIESGLLPASAFPLRDELRLVALHPDGPDLTATSTGDPLVRHGESDYVKAMAAGHEWAPRDASKWKGAIARSELPEWLLTLV